MIIIQKELCPSGAYQTPQSWPYGDIPDNFACVSDSVDLELFYLYSGFVIPVFEQIDGLEIMTGYSPNVEAWEFWKASLPDPKPKPAPQPTMQERVTILEEQLSQTDETAIALYEAQLAQEEINKSQDESIAVQNETIAAQDETLIMLYEMIGG